jgi:hypothetical protein
MIGLVLLLVFVLVLTVALRQGRKVPPQETIIAIIPIVIEQGVALAVLPDDTRAQITFEGHGLQSDRLPVSGLQIIEVQENVHVKAPVQLARYSAPKISALSFGPDVKAVTLDFGTRQMMLHGKEMPHATQFKYEHNGSSRVTLIPASPTKAWSRLGDVSVDLDRSESSGSFGSVRCSGAQFLVTHSVPNHNTVVGRRDVLGGKHRLTFNLRSKTAFVQ